MTKQPVSSSSGQRRKKAGRKGNYPFFSVLLILCAVFLTCCVVMIGYVVSLKSELPEITAEDLTNAQTSFVYNDQAEVVAELHGGEDRTNVDLAEVSPYFLDSLIAREDIRFYSHSGVDFRSIARALVVDIKDSIASGGVTFTQGASTITMQLVKNVIDETEKTIPRKIKQALLAVEFEKNYGKDEILYYYVNEIYLGPGVYGVEAAADYYFNKSAADLSLSESAVIVGLISNPGLYSPFENPEGCREKRDQVLESLVKYKSEYAAQAEAAKAEEIQVYVGEEEDESTYQHPWFVDYVISEAEDILSSLGRDSSLVYTGGFNIYTTLNETVQNALETVYSNPDNFPDSSTEDIVESAMAITNPNTGAVVGLVGGREYTARRGFNRATDLIRSPGSTIKPVVVYGPALELGYGTGYVLDDIPFTLGSWSPKNDDGAYMGLITMRTAVIRSRNIYAVKMLQEIGSETGYHYANEMGLNLDPSDAGNLAIALGGLTTGVSPLQMAAAFATFANAGIYTEPYTITSITTSDGEEIYSVDPVQNDVFTAQTAHMMTSMLKDAVSSGTGYRAKISGWETAGKTGTNGLPSGREDPDYAGKSGTKDAWFCGYTQVLSGAVWVGYDNKKDENGTLQYLSNVYGGSYPAQIFNKVMTLALEGQDPVSFKDPGGISWVDVDTKTGGLPTELTPDEYVRSEMYVSGQGPTSAGVSEWRTVQICQDSQCIASAYCPNVTTASRLVATVDPNWSDSTISRISDYSLRISDQICEVHTTYQTGLQAVYVCTDPAHNGQLVLANVAGQGGEGGCPEEYVELRYYSPSSIPTQQCNLPGHEVTSYGSFDDPNDGSNFLWNWGNANSTVKPSTPYGLNGQAYDSYIYLSWSVGSQPGDVVYIVERSHGNDTERYQVSNTEYLDSSVTEGETYTYRVYAYSAASKATSGWSEKVSVTY